MTRTAVINSGSTFGNDNVDIVFHRRSGGSNLPVTSSMCTLMSSAELLTNYRFILVVILKNLNL